MSNDAFALAPCPAKTVEEDVEFHTTIVTGTVKSCADFTQLQSAHHYACPRNEWHFTVDEYIKDKNQLGKKEIIVRGLESYNNKTPLRGKRYLLFLWKEKNYVGNCGGAINIDSNTESQPTGFYLGNMPVIQRTASSQYYITDLLQNLRDWRDGKPNPFAPFWRVVKDEYSCTLLGEGLEFRYQHRALENEPPYPKTLKFLSADVSNGEKITGIKQHRLYRQWNSYTHAADHLYISVNEKHFVWNVITYYFEYKRAPMKTHSLFLSDRTALTILDGLSDSKSTVSVIPRERSAGQRYVHNWDGALDTSRFGTAKNDYLDCVAGF